jgi:hypothetical protein
MLASALAIGICTAPLLGAVPVSAAPGERASGTIVVETQLQGADVTLGGNIVLYRRGPLYRLDLLSLGIPGSDPTTSAMFGALLGPGGATIIYDGATGSISAYANGNRTSYTASPTPAAAAAAPPSAPGAPRANRDPLAILAAIAKATANVQQASIILTGHAPMNGHPTSDFDVQLERDLPGNVPEKFHAQFALADDLDGFPVKVTAESSGRTTGKFQLNLTTIEAASPGDEMFAIPVGYTRVNSIGDVLRPPH